MYSLKIGQYRKSPNHTEEH